jgi:hypothetical protein
MNKTSTAKVIQLPRKLQVFVKSVLAPSRKYTKAQIEPVVHFEKRRHVKGDDKVLCNGSLYEREIRSGHRGQTHKSIYMNNYSVL